MCLTSPEFALAVGRGALGVALLSLCGYAVWWLTRAGGRDSASRLATSLGAGISVIACCWLLSAVHSILLWVGLSLVVFLSSAMLLWDLLKHPRRKRVGAFCVASACTLGLLAWRMYQVRDLVFPPWVDSVHHAVIIRKMLETSQLPRDLSPYLQMPFFYHFAFHGIASLFAAIARLSIPQSMIVMGQVLQVGVALSVYCLGRVLWPERLWAVVATALACLVSQMPAYYTAWGKYPLLTAMTLAPLAMGMVITMIRDGGSPRTMVALATLVAGMALAHLFATLLLIIFIGIAVAQAAWPMAWRGARQHLPSRNRHQTTQALRRGWQYVVGGTALGMVAVWPWGWWVWRHTGRFVRVQVGRQVLAPSASYFPGYLSYLWQLSGPTRNRLLLVLALPGAGLALRRPCLRSVGLWLIALLLLTNPWGLRLSPFSPDRALIVLFLPACILVTEALRAVAGQLGRWQPLGVDSRRATQFAAVLVAAWAIWGGLETRNLVPESAILASEPDGKAMVWTKSHVPPEARFFIEVAPWPPYGYRGVDGGWWLLPMTGRHTLLPPALYGLGDSSQVERTNEMARKASAIAGCGPQFWELVAHEGLTHIYFNTHRASLRPRSFDDCPSIDRIYAQDGVFIYQLMWPPPN